MVLETYENTTEELVHISVGEEKFVTTTGPPFYVENRGWTEAGELKREDNLLLSTGEWVEISNIETELPEEAVTVYNFAVEDYHTYHVGESGVLVHNACGVSGTSSITRSSHAEIRNSQGRSVGNAINDVNRATPSKIYMQNDGRYVVQGNNGRVHILEQNGEIVTTMNKVTNFGDRVRSGRYNPLTEIQKLDFVGRFGQYLNGSWDSYRPK